MARALYSLGRSGEFSRGPGRGRQPIGIAGTGIGCAPVQWAKDQQARVERTAGRQYRPSGRGGSGSTPPEHHRSASPVRPRASSGRAARSSRESVRAPSTAASQPEPADRRRRFRPSRPRHRLPLAPGSPRRSVPSVPRPTRPPAAPRPAPGQGRAHPSALRPEEAEPVPGSSSLRRRPAWTKVTACSFARASALKNGRDGSSQGGTRQGALNRLEPGTPRCSARSTLCAGGRRRVHERAAPCRPRRASAPAGSSRRRRGRGFRRAPRRGFGGIVREVRRRSGSRRGRGLRAAGDSRSSTRARTASGGFLQAGGESMRSRRRATLHALHARPRAMTSARSVSHGP